MKYSIQKKRLQLLLSILFISLCSISAQAHFGSKGPFGGTVTCTTVAGDTIYVGTAEGGVYESTNSTLISWRARPVGLKSGKVTAIAHTGVRLYAATADSGIFILNGYVGSDRYWNKVNTGLINLHVTSLVAINATTLMAGTTTGIFISTNSGASWSPKNGGLNTLDITALEKADSRIFCTSMSGGVYYTDNYGNTWNDFNNSNTNAIGGTIEMSYNALTNQLLLVNETGLYLTDNASTATASSFLLATTGLPANCVVSDLSNDGSNWFAASDKGVFRSSSSTISWISSNEGLTTMDVKAIVPFKNGLVCGTRTKGIFKTDLNVITWSSMNVNFNNLKTTAMYVNGASFVVAATENGVYVSKDLAANYTSANNGLHDSLHVSDLTMAGTILIAATTTGGIYISIDSGMNWTKSNAGLGSLNIKKLSYSNSVLYAIDAMNHIYKTPTPTFNWVLNQTGLPLNVVPTSIVFFANNVLVSTYGKGVFVKPLNGTTWKSFNLGLSDWNVTSSTVLGNKMYVGTDGTGVFVSDTAIAAIQWVSTASTANAIPHTDLMHLDGTKIQAMGTGAGYVWASYKGGLLATSTQGDSWIAGGNQFNLPSFTDVLKIMLVTTRVFVLTENNGLYSNALSEIPTVLVTPTGILTSNTVDNAVIKVAPNPSTGIFNLSSEGVYGTITEIIIYDYAGSIKGRFDGIQKQFNLNYEPGMYVVLVKTNADGVYSQKIIIQ